MQASTSSNAGDDDNNNNNDSDNNATTTIIARRRAQRHAVQRSRMPSPQPPQSSQPRQRFCTLHEELTYLRAHYAASSKARALQRAECVRLQEQLRRYADEAATLRERLSRCTCDLDEYTNSSSCGSMTMTTSAAVDARRRRQRRQGDATSSSRDVVVVAPATRDDDTRREKRRDVDGTPPPLPPTPSLLPQRTTSALSYAQQQQQQQQLVDELRANVARRDTALASLRADYAALAHARDALAAEVQRGRVDVRVARDECTQCAERLAQCMRELRTARDDALAAATAHARKTTTTATRRTTTTTTTAVQHDGDDGGGGGALAVRALQAQLRDAQVHVQHLQQQQQATASAIVSSAAAQKAALQQRLADVSNEAAQLRAAQQREVAARQYSEQARDELQHRLQQSETRVQQLQAHLSSTLQLLHDNNNNDNDSNKLQPPPRRRRHSYADAMRRVYAALDRAHHHAVATPPPPLPHNERADSDAALLPHDVQSQPRNNNGVEAARQALPQPHAAIDTSNNNNNNNDNTQAATCVQLRRQVAQLQQALHTSHMAQRRLRARWRTLHTRTLTPLGHDNLQLASHVEALHAALTAAQRERDEFAQLLTLADQHGALTQWLQQQQQQQQQEEDKSLATLRSGDTRTSTLCTI